MLIGIDEQVKALLTREKKTLKELVRLLHEQHEQSPSSANLSNKLSRDSLRYSEAQQIADVLGYEIIWKKKES